MDFSIAFDSLAALLLVFVRMAGLLLLNPLLSRRNIPAQVRVALVLGLAVLIAPGLDRAGIAGYTGVDLVVAMLRELFIGFCASYVFLVFYYLLYFAGDFLDMQMGLSMAKVFDPGTNIQASVTGNLLSYLFILYLFTTDSHLLMLRIFATSYQVVPLGAGELSGDIRGFAINLLISAFSLILRLTLPIVAAEFVLEVGMGVLMKLIPQIHVFVINIQLKLLLGILLLFLFSSPMAGFLDNYMDLMFQTMQKSLVTLGG